MKDLKYEHQSIQVGGWLGGWRVHGVGSGGVGGWRVHGVGGCVVLWVVVWCKVGGWLES